MNSARDLGFIRVGRNRRSKPPVTGLDQINSVKRFVRAHIARRLRVSRNAMRWAMTIAQSSEKTIFCDQSLGSLVEVGPHKVTRGRSRSFYSPSLFRCGSAANLHAKSFEFANDDSVFGH